jgi:hypothetical protein
MGVSFPAVFRWTKSTPNTEKPEGASALGPDPHCIDPGARETLRSRWPGGDRCLSTVAPLRLNCRVGIVADVTDFEALGDLADDDAFGEDIHAIEAELAEAKARVAEVPAQVVVLNHAMGLYELGAIHLSATPPRLTEAVLAIDAFACLVEGLGERLGEEAPMLQQALQQIRLAFVQIKGTMA